MKLPASGLVLRLTISRAASAGLSLLLSMALIRLLTKDDYGRYYIYWTQLTFVNMLPSLAVNNAFVYCYQESKDKGSLFSTFMALKGVIILCSCLVLIGLWLTGVLDGFGAIAISSGLFLSLFDSAICLSQARKQFNIYAFLTPVRNFVIILMLMGVYSRAHALNLRSVMGTMFVSSVLLAIIATLLSRDLNWAGASRQGFHELMGGAKRFVAFEGSAVILQRIEVWVMGYYSAQAILSLSDVAEYGAGFTFAFLFPIISSAVTSILITSVTRGERIGKAGLKRMSMVAGATFLLAMLYSLLSYQATRLLVSHTYHELYWIIPAICLGMFFSFCSNYFRVASLAFEGDTHQNRVYASQAVIGILASVLLIKKFGLPGAVAGFLISRGYVLIFIGWKFVTENLAEA